jgi:predicted dehydrogenase
MHAVDRRHFLKTSAATLAGLSALTYAGAADKPNEKIVLAFMGVRGRGKELLRGFSKLDNVEVAYVCDPDENVVPPALKELNKNQKRTPKVEKDVRRVLEERDVTALVIAAPDHWHALGTVWACQAGKDVYVEKPVSHNIIEGRRMVEAARRYERVVQVGTQRRSGAHFATAAEFIRAGRLGKVPFARTSIAGNRKSIGHKPDGPVPAGVDYNLWLGAAPERPFNPNRFHYNWHWNWDYGTAEIGNNGIHCLDVARWLLGLDAPLRVTAGGGKFFYDDDQQTPDTMTATFDFDHTTVLWEHRIWSKTGFMGENFGIALYGEKGTMILNEKGWRVIDCVDAVARQVWGASSVTLGASPPGTTAFSVIAALKTERPVIPGKFSDKSSDIEGAHLRNFLACVRDRKRPNADIEEGHKSTRLCHLGNIAYRVGRVLHFDAATETIHGDSEANRLLGRTYREPFVVPEKV